MKTLMAAAAAALLLLTNACSPATGSATTAEAAERAPAATRASASPDAEGGFSLYDLGSSWVDQRGDSLRLDGLAGKIRIVSLVYTSCHTTCPAILVELKRIESAIPADRRDDVGFVLVSLDPGRDSPGRLADWGRGNRLDPTRWTLLNGTDAAVREIAATLGIRYQTLPDGEVAHANVITVLDERGAAVHQQVTLGDETTATAAAVIRLLE